MAKYRAAKVPELVHGDICGPIMPETHGGCKYFILLVDDCSWSMWLQLMTSKSEAAEAIKKFKARAEAEISKKLSVPRTDRGGKFTSTKFVAYYTKEGVVRHHTASYTPQQNGVVERRNQIWLAWRGR